MSTPTPVYSIYINYHTLNSTLVTTETKLYDVPCSRDNPNLLSDPKVKTEMGKTGSFEFSVYYSHPYYNCWNQMKTMLRVEYFGTTIFYGRVLTIDVDHITSKKTVHCEGYLAFLMDSQQEGIPDNERPRMLGSAYVSQLINNHNAQLIYSVPSKYFAIGMVPGNYSGANADQQIKMESESLRFGSSSWQDTASCFSSLIKEYGGYLRTRYVNGTVYLDWLDSYFTPNVGSRVIEVGENVISMSSNAEVENIFTVLIPIGKNATNAKSSDAVMLSPHKELYVNQIGTVYTDEELNVGYHNKDDYLSSLDKYGIIYKTQNFGNADTVDKLRAWAWDWIKNNYHGGLTSFNATAVDMKVIGGTDPILSGDQVYVRYPSGNGTQVQKTMTVLSVEFDLVNPQNNNYSIGIPDIALNRSYGENGNKSSGGSGSAKAGGGSRLPDDSEETKAKVDHFFHAHVLYASETDPNYKIYKDKYGDEAASSLLQSSVVLLDSGIDEEGEPEAVKENKTKAWTMWLDGKAGTLTGFKPPDDLGEHDAEWYEEYYKTQSTIVMSALEGALTINERVEESTAWAKEYFAEHPPKKVIEIGTEVLKNGAGTVCETFGQILTKSVERAGQTFQTIVRDDTSSVIDGLTGLFVGTSTKLARSLGAAIDNIRNDRTGSTSGTVNLDGATAQIDMTNLPQDPINALRTIVIGGDGSNGEGLVEVGKTSGSNSFNTAMNKVVTYLDENNVQRTYSGFVAAKDYQMEGSYDSLKVRLLVVAELIADRATIADLHAAEARITTLESTTITTNSLSAAISNLNMVSAQAIAVTNGISVAGVSSFHGSVIFNGGIYKGGTSLSLKTQSVVTSASISLPSLSKTSSHQFEDTNGAHVTGALVSSWSSGRVDIDTTTLTYLGA